MRYLQQPMTLYLATHATTFDNEQGIASGHKDVELSLLVCDPATVEWQPYWEYHV